MNNKINLAPTTRDQLEALTLAEKKKFADLVLKLVRSHDLTGGEAVAIALAEVRQKQKTADATPIDPADAVRRYLDRN